MIHSLATITGDGATHALSASAVKASWVQIQAPSTNSAAVRVGDSNTSSTRGATVAAGGFQFAPSHGNANMYDLNTIYYYAETGDEIDVIYNTF